MRPNRLLLLNIVALTMMVGLSYKAYSQSIHEAVKTNKTEQVKLLLQGDATLANSVDAENNTPLILASVDPNVDIEIVKLLIQFGADLSLGDVDNTTPLHLAAYTGHIDAAKILIQHKALIDFKDNRQQTPLLFAVVSGNIEIAKLLVEHGADVNAKIEYSGTSLLHLALSRGKETMAEFLISKGAKIDVRDNRGRLPLYDALDIGSHQLINLILEKGTEINISRDGNYFVNAAIACGHNKLINKLIERGINVKEVDLIGQTLMHRASASGMVKLMGTLADKGLGIDKEDVYGKRPLHMAVKRGEIEAVEFLLDKGANINSKTPMGKTPLHLAQESEQTAIVDLLIQHGAKQKDWKLPKMRARYLDKNLPKKIPRLFAPGIISTEENHEYAISFHPEGKELLLSTRVPPEHNGDNNRIMSMKFENNRWSSLKLPSFASDIKEGEPIFSPDGKNIIFTSSRPAPGSSEIKRDTWIADYSKSESAPQLLPEPFKNPQYLMYVSSTMDNKIYFTSEGGIYSAVKTETGYEEAVFLSSAINNPTMGVHPFIAPDESYLIFDASGRPDGLGESDLYISFKMKDGSWSRAQNLGDKINSPANEICASISGDGKYMFFLSRRNGKGDIYWVDTSFLEELRNNAIRKNNEMFKLQNQTLGNTRSFSINHGDLNGNGYQDIFLANYFSPSRIWSNKGDNTFEVMTDNIPTSAQREHGAAIGDLDKDGDLDILLVNTAEGQSKVFLNDGGGDFNKNVIPFGTEKINYNYVSLKDADSDGDLDAFVNVYMKSNELWLNDGRGNFSKSRQVIGDEKSGTMGIADLDGDNDVDIFLTIEDALDEIWLNDGKGNFEKGTQKLGKPEGYEKIALADFDNDGDIDAITGSRTQGITVFINDGEANFTTKGDPFWHGINIIPGDIDNDGDIDFYSTHRLKTNLLWLNDGNANFTKSYFFDESSINADFVDIENDGDLDIVLSKDIAGGNIIYINQIVK